ncbi:putative AAA family ATPase [Faustovirus]|nr:putative AAA family ATPase [Faustovirus]
MSGDHNTKDKLTRFVKTCETAVNAMLPMLLVNHGLSANYVVVVMPIFVFLLEMIRTFITAPRVASGIVVYEAGKHGWYNQYYIYISWYIANKVKNVNQTFIKLGYDSVKDESDKYIRTAPGTYYIDYKKATIKAVCESKTDESRNNNIINLSHHDQELLREFVFWCQEKYEERFKHDINMYTYASRQWNSSVIANNKTPDYLFISPKLHEKIFTDAVKFAKSEAYYKQNCIAWKRGYLFYGTPGCGKTSAILALAQLLRRSIYKINTREYESNSAFESMCRTIPKESIITIEDIDSLGSVETRYKYTMTREQAVKFVKMCGMESCNDDTLRDDDLDLVDILCGTTKEPRGKYWDNFYIDYLGCRLCDCSDKQQALCQVMDNTRPEFKNYAFKTISSGKNDVVTLDTILNVLDGNTYFYGCIIIITTNAVQRLDPAVIRPGRVEVKCEFTPADAGILRDMYLKYCKRELNFEIPDSTRITQSKVVHEVFVGNDMDPDACERALKAIIEGQHAAGPQTSKSTSVITNSTAPKDTAIILTNSGSSELYTLM